MKFKNTKRVMLSTLSLLLVNCFTFPIFAADIDVLEEMSIPSNVEVEDSDVYLEITDDNMQLLSLDDSYNDTIGILMKKHYSFIMITLLYFLKQ